MEKIIDLHDDIIAFSKVMYDDGHTPARLYINSNNYWLMQQWSDDVTYAGLDVVHNYDLPINRFFILSEQELKYSEYVQHKFVGGFDSVNTVEDVQLSSLKITVNKKGVTVTVGIPFSEFNHRRDYIDERMNELRADLLVSIDEERGKYNYLKFDYPD